MTFAGDDVSFIYFESQEWQDFLQEVRKKYGYELPPSVDMRFHWEGFHQKLVGQSDLNAALKDVTAPADKWGGRIYLKESAKEDFPPELRDLAEGMLAEAKKIPAFLMAFHPDGPFS